MKKILIALIVMLSFGLIQAQDEVIRMTTDLAAGSYIKLIIKCDKADSSSIWIDLNNNDTKDEGEGSVGLTYPGEMLMIAQYKIESKNISIYGNVRGINILKNSITSLDVSECNTLASLTILENFIKLLDISKNTNLESLIITDNIIQSMDLTNNAKLKLVSIGSSNLNNIIFNENSIIDYLELQKNQFSTLELSKLEKLEQLILRDNLQLKSIDLSMNPNLKELDITSSRITELDLTNNPKLIRLTAYSNLLEDLDMSKNVMLQSLNVDKGKLKKLTLPKSDSLSFISFNKNQVEELIYHKYPLAKAFYCNSNKLKSLNFEGWDSLIFVQCYDNEITGEESKILLNSLKDRSSTSSGTIFFVTTKTVANDKNWAYKQDVADVKLKNWVITDYPTNDYIGIDPPGAVDNNNTFISLFPCPTSDYLNIKYIENISGEVEIYNLTGEVLLRCTPSPSIDIRVLPAGVYYAKINNQLNKFIKK